MSQPERADRLYYKGKWVQLFSKPLTDWFVQGNPKPYTLRHGRSFSWYGDLEYKASWTIQDDKLYLVSIHDSMFSTSNTMDAIFDEKGAPRNLCPECGLMRQIKNDREFCPACGTGLQTYPCLNCGYLVRSITLNFCPVCEVKLRDWPCLKCGYRAPEKERSRTLLPPESYCIKCGSKLPPDMRRRAQLPDDNAPSGRWVFASWFSGALRIPKGKVLGYVFRYPIYERELLIHVEAGWVGKEEIHDNHDVDLDPMKHCRREGVTSLEL